MINDISKLLLIIIEKYLPIIFVLLFFYIHFKFIKHHQRAVIMDAGFKIKKILGPRIVFIFWPFEKSFIVNLHEKIHDWKTLAEQDLQDRLKLDIINDSEISNVVKIYNKLRERKCTTTFRFSFSRK